MSLLLAARTDANQAEIVKGLRAAGCAVISLHRVGDGCPDLIVGRAGKNWLIEVKTEGRGLNEKQKTWHAWWAGQRAIVTELEGALRVVGLLK